MAQRVKGSEKVNNDLVFKLTKRTIVISLFIIGIMAFAFKEPMPMIQGYIFGTIISILGFKLLQNTINKAVEMTPSRASSYSMVHYILRYVIYAVVLTVSALAGYLNFPATLLGLLMIKFVILGSGIIDKNFLK